MNCSRSLLDSMSLPALALAPLLSLVALMAFTPPVHAQPDVDKKQLASQYTDEGLSAQAVGDYDTALNFYKKAYEQIPHPLLLFNMAQAHRLAGRPAKARVLYQRYLEIEPNGVKSKTARENLTAIDKQLADLDAEQRTDASTGEPMVLAPLSEPPSWSQSLSEPSTSIRTNPGPESGQPEAGGGRGWLPYTLMAVGGVAIAGGVVGVLIDEDPKLDPTVKQPATIMDTGRLGAGMIAGGVILAGFGGVMWWSAGDKPKKKRTVTSIVPTRSGALVGVGGTF